MSAPSRPQLIREYHGYVSADKANDSRILYVYSEELLPFLQGEVHATEHENEISTNDGKNEYTGTLKTTNSLKCYYRDNGTNNLIPPSVRKGEQVTVYNLGDTSMWYWKSDGRNDNLRRLDTVRYGVSATRENAGELDDDNTYFLEFDTRGKKRVRLSTSKADGEKFRYLFEFDSDNGHMMLCDDNENMIYMESETPRICMKNKSGSLIDLNIENIIQACKGDMTFITEQGSMLFRSGKHITMNAAGNLNISFGGTAVMSGSNGGTITLNCGGFAVNRNN